MITSNKEMHLETRIAEMCISLPKKSEREQEIWSRTFLVEESWRVPKLSEWLLFNVLKVMEIIYSERIESFVHQIKLERSCVRKRVKQR